MEQPQKKVLAKRKNELLKNIMKKTAKKLMNYHALDMKKRLY